MTRLLLALVLLLPLTACLEESEPGFQGYVEGEYLRMAAPDGGWLETIAVAKGTQVAAGAVLFTLDASRETAALAEAGARRAQAERELADLLTGSRPEEIAAIEAQIDEAAASVHLTELTLARQLQLLTTHVVAQSQVDAAQAAAEQARAQLARIQAQLATARLPARAARIAAARAAAQASSHAVEQATAQLARRQIAAPAAALVDDVVRRPGEWVPANGVVVSLLAPAAVKAVFFVPEPARAAIRPDAVLDITCTGCPPGLTARVSRIASEAEYTPPVIYSRETRAKLVFRVEARLADMPGAPLPGQPITARLRP